MQVAQHRRSHGTLLDARLQFADITCHHLPFGLRLRTEMFPLIRSCCCWHHLWDFQSSVFYTHTYLYICIHKLIYILANLATIWLQLTIRVAVVVELTSAFNTFYHHKIFDVFSCTEVARNMNLKLPQNFNCTITNKNGNAKICQIWSDMDMLV